MEKIMNFLQGKKTYIIMILGFVFNFGLVSGWWTVDNQTWIFIDNVLMFLGLGTLRAGVSNSQKS